MFDKRKKEQLEQLSPEALAAVKKQRSMNRIFGLLAVVGVILLAMLIYEIVLLIIR